MNRLNLGALIIMTVLNGVCAAEAAEPAANYDESKIPPYALPDPLVLADGQRVTDAATWREKRRPEIVALFEKHVYGKAPGRPADMSFEPGPKADALDGKAVRREIVVRVSKDPKAPQIHLLMYLPKPAGKPAPVFLSLNFHGNHVIHRDPGITLPEGWLPNQPDVKITSNQASEKQRGMESSRWPVQMLLARGYGLVTAYYGDIEPDVKDGLDRSVRALYLKPGQTRPAADEWGAIAAWAWGLSRIMDYLLTDTDVDARHVALLGHSRLGKTALWAGARDERFGMVISNDSGCGGASLARRGIGETVRRINASFPHWFCDNYKQYGTRVADMPVDQHMLMALVAPRPLYVASAEEDRWADPHGEFLSAKGADPVYRLLGTDGLAAADMPPVQQPVVSTISYHIRHGKHDVTDYDWQRYLDFADAKFGKK